MVIVAVPVVELLFRKVVAERIGTILLSALIAHTGWHWMTARGSQLLAYDFRWPALDVSLAAALMRWAVLVLIIVGAAWVLERPFRRLTASLPGGRPAGDDTRPAST